MRPPRQVFLLYVLVICTYMGFQWTGFVFKFKFSLRRAESNLQMNNVTEGYNVEKMEMTTGTANNQSVLFQRPLKLAELPVRNSLPVADDPHRGIHVAGSPRPTSGFLTIGMPSVKRAVGYGYLLTTIQSLIDHTSEEDKSKTVVVVFLADEDRTYNQQVQVEMISRYKKYLDSGFLQIIQAEPSLYPTLQISKRNFNDSPDRVRWRSKQVADYAILFRFSQNISQYYMQIEDDITTADSFVQRIDEFIKLKNAKPWAVLEFSSVGFIGKLFKSEDLEKLSVFMLTFYQEQPVDWLIDYFRMTMTQRDKILRKPPLFLHIGKKSSFSGNKDRIVQGAKTLIGKKRNQNPEAVIITSMKAYQDHLPENAFLYSNDFFWAVHATKGDTLNVVLKQELLLSSITVQTGSVEKPNDILHIGTVQISHAVKTMNVDNLEVTCEEPFLVGNLEKGVLRKDNLQQLYPKKTKCLIITVAADQSDWIIFSDITLKGV